MNRNQDDPVMLNPLNGASSDSIERSRPPWGDFYRDSYPSTNVLDVSFEDSKSLIDYLRTILYRKWTVAGVFVLVLSLAAAYAYTRVPVYRAEATIEVEKVYPASSNMTDLFAFFGQFDLFYQTQMESMKSRSVAESFLKRFEASKPATSAEDKGSSADTPRPDGTQQVPGANENAEVKKAGSLSSVLSRISVNPVKGTQMIQVTLDANDPGLAQRMLQVYLAAFIEETQRKRSDLTDKVRGWLRNELSEAEKQLRKSEADLMAFTAKHDIVPSERVPNQVLGFFGKATENLVESKATRLSLEAMDNAKEKVLPSQVNNEYLQSLRSQLAQLRSEYTGMAAIYHPDYFKLALLRNKIQNMEKAIEEVEKNSLSSALSQAKQKETMSEQAYDKLKQDALQASSVSVQYEILKKIVEANGQMYVMLLQRAKQAELDHGTLGHNIVISSAPTLPLSPILPNKSKILLMGAILGLLGGVGLALALAQIDRTVQTPEEIRKHLNLPILGAVPRIAPQSEEFEEMEPGDRHEFLAYRNPSSPFTDAVRIVQNTASAFMPGDASCSVCISSALPLEGKTLLSIVMGTVIASEHKNVLVIDGDLRRPRIHSVFNVRGGETGLSDLITGKCTELKEAVRQSHVPGMYYMTSGTIPENPVALLKTMRMQQILEACKKVFDVVVLDAPPVLGLVDARILSSYCDGLILVTKAGHTSIEMLRQAKEAVFQGQGRLLGIVLNMTERKHHGYYYYNHKYHYHRKTA
ncbi:MAG: polysaccharide biosynthesis tyrosine autokinase [Desulfomonile tiedjei]|nr:polysaccharide biosynthesis tyrosine autokinase [Desulfomonile tiedjei]